MAGLEPIRLSAKEGLALLNGTEGMLAHLCLALADLEVAAATADVTCALSVEALLGTDPPFAGPPAGPAPPPGPGGQRGQPPPPAGRLADRGRPTATPTTPSRTPTRCAAPPRSTGPPGTWSTGAGEVVERELARSPTTRWCSPRPTSVISTGNFHGQPLAFAADFAGHRPGRPGRHRPSGGSTGSWTRPAPTACRRSWPARPGVNSGFMLAHYTAAALVNRTAGAWPRRRRATPSPPPPARRTTCRWAGTPACSCGRAVADAMRVVAIELVCAAEAVDLRAPALAPGRRRWRPCLAGPRAWSPDGRRPLPGPRPGRRRGPGAHAARLPWSGSGAGRRARWT